jgi:pimeloyl-ACP methyl ester carboxylesterase
VLASFIVDEILGNHPEWDSVDVVNHSMGGLVTREAYRQIGDKIRRIAYLASPHFGSPKAYFVLHPEIEISFGSFFDDVLAELVWDRIFKIPGDPDDLDAAIKGLADQFQSVYELLPDEFYFEKHLIVSVDAEFPNPDRNVTKPEPTYITDVCQLPQGRHGLAQEALAFKRALGRDIPPSDEGSRLIVYSNTKVTTDRIEFDQDALDDFEDPFDSGQQGDGTVPSYSGRAGYKKAVMVGEDHCTVPNCQNTFRALRHFLAH